VRRVIWLLQVVLLSVACNAALASAADPPQNLRSRLTNIASVQKNSASRPIHHLSFIIINKDKEDEEFEISSLRIEQTVSGSKTLQLKLPALKPGIYKFVGEFHEKTAKAVS